MKIILYFCCWLLEKLCCLIHPFNPIEIELTGHYCNLVRLALWMDEKFDLGFWTPKEEK